ncbi:MAG: hypothetical protein HOE30_08485 [Deltaproteobacteria bacterium]|jgi:hypothetical protein|nr:hypothetical protein [Deltaproteobacteria bacterium]
MKTETIMILPFTGEKIKQNEFGYFQGKYKDGTEFIYNFPDIMWSEFQKKNGDIIKIMAFQDKTKHAKLKIGWWILKDGIISQQKDCPAGFFTKPTTTVELSHNNINNKKDE